MAANPERGDPSRREDDRYLFLEALLSARQVFYLSYVGQSIDDNSRRPPSAVVSELLDYIEEGFLFTGQDALERIVVRHPLQAFSPAYFTGVENLFSYSGENFQAARHASTERRAATPFIGAALPEPPEEWRDIDLEDLCRFYANPSRYLLNRRLGIRLEDESLVLEENEPFSLEGLERYDLRQYLTSQALSGKDIRSLYPVLAASGVLPHGAPGRLAYDGLCRFVDEYVDVLRPWTSGGRQTPFAVDLQIGPFHLSGLIDALYGGGPVFYRATGVKARDLLRAWIFHLALQKSGRPVRSILIFEDRQLALRPPAESGNWLDELLRLYLKGLSEPIKLFPESSLAYAKEMIAGRGVPLKALRAARNKWDGFQYGEKDDAAYRLCFGHTDPLDEAFMTLATAVLGPLLGHMESLP